MFRKLLSVVISNRSVARRRGADARNVSRGIVVRESAADYFMRLGRGGNVCGLATGCGLESTILAVSGMRAGRVGSSQPRLDVLRNCAAHGTPTGSVVRFLFGTQSIFFALAVF